MDSFGISPVFVGRAEEMRVLTEHSRRSRTAAATLLLRGEAGVGKSRLLAEFASRTDNGLVAVGGCLELGVDGLPFAPFAAVLRRLLRELGAEPFSDPDGGPGELARLLPELGPPPREYPEARSRLFEQVLRLLTIAAEPSGLTVIVEDLQWADSATRHLLVFLVHNLDTARVQIVAGYRSDDIHRDHPLRRLVPELERLPSVSTLELRPLDREQVAEQVRAIKGGDPTSRELDVLYERTAGNPLFVESFLELPGPIGDAIPERSRELLLGPLRGLGAEARSVATIVSVGARSGPRVEHRLLARVAELDEDRLDHALHALVDANLLRVEETGYRFRHALLRDAVHAELLPGRHGRLHLAYAKALEEDAGLGSGADSGTEAGAGAGPGGNGRANVVADSGTENGTGRGHGHVAELAHHYYEADEWPRALTAAWTAADIARGSFGYDEQLHLLERVIKLWDRVPDAVERVGASLPDVLELAAEAAIDSGETNRGLDLAEAGLRELPDSDDPVTATRRALLLRRRGQATRDLYAPGPLTDLRAAESILPKDSPHRPSVLVTLAKELATQGYFDEAVAAANQAIAHARAEIEAARTDDGTGEGRGGDRHAGAPRALPAPWSHTASEMHARTTLLTVDHLRGHSASALAQTEALLADVRRIDDSFFETRITGVRVALLWETGRNAEAVRVGRAGLERARELSTARTVGGFIAVNLVEALYYLGEFAECIEVATRVLSHNPLLLYQPIIRGRRGLAALVLGDVDAAREDQKFQRHTIDKIVHAQDEAAAVLLDLELLLVDGEVDAALRTALTVLDTMEIEKWPAYGWHLLDIATRIVLASTDSTDSTDSAEESARPARLLAHIVDTRERMQAAGPSQDAFHANIRAHLAELDVASPGAVRDAWRTSVDAWRAAEDPYRLAVALLHRAECDAAEGDRAAAATAVRESVAVAERLSAAPLLRRGIDLARRVGASLEPGTTAPSDGLSTLTPRETEVLRLLAHGRTNAQIAEKLFISAKTASVHVSNILAKLPAPNRATAGARARELGLV